MPPSTRGVASTSYHLTRLWSCCESVLTTSGLSVATLKFSYASKLVWSSPRWSYSSTPAFFSQLGRSAVPFHSAHSV